MKQITCPHCGDTYPDFDVAHVCSKGPYAPKLKSKMNERIKELAEQAGFIDRGTNHTAYMNFDHEKFAELVVKETMQVVANQLPSNQYLDVADAVIKHFGVEE